MKFLQILLQRGKISWILFNPVYDVILSAVFKIFFLDWYLAVRLAERAESVIQVTVPCLTKVQSTTEDSPAVDG